MYSLIDKLKPLQSNQNENISVYIQRDKTKDIQIQWLCLQIDNKSTLTTAMHWSLLLLVLLPYNASSRSFVISFYSSKKFKTHLSVPFFFFPFTNNHVYRCSDTFNKVNNT